MDLKMSYSRITKTEASEILFFMTCSYTRNCLKKVKSRMAKSRLHIANHIPKFIFIHFHFIYSHTEIYIVNFLCSHIAQLVEAGRGHLNKK